VQWLASMVAKGLNPLLADDPGLGKRLQVCLHATQGPSNPQSKVIVGRFRQLLAINAHKMAPSTGQWL
jgi:hypothetical protein